MRDKFESYMDKHLRVFLKDGFIKDGIFIGYNLKFIFLKFNDGREVSIAQDEIREIQVKK